MCPRSLVWIECEPAELMTWVQIPAGTFLNFLIAINPGIIENAVIINRKLPENCNI